ncbi:Flp pilus assembly protein CpaB [Vibrio salinus]|uniref:Flp pilus assembly protein CpaB n=1 Tax=Vibrio salinus TaxID=2899784 RepID=UPI001E599B24|nr:Flp pilus assembly protein CpaB [Vibrio salinus]MCE0495915.1 Flp pilus assembly protein CpaB [Vibrio salinus]
MKVSSVLFISGAFVIALGGTFVMRGLAEPAPKAEVSLQPVAVTRPAHVYTPVLVASRDIHPGEFIDGGAIHWQAVKKDYPKALYLKKDSIDLASNFGATVRKLVKKGDLLTYSLVVKPGEPGFLASVLHKGMRAVAIPTNAVASNAGLVSAGDHVDVILGLKKENNVNVSGDDTSSVQPPMLASQTLVTNVRVLALNNVVRSGVQVRSQDNKKRKDDNQYFETVTLEVTPKQSERLAVAREIGTLQLALRAVGDNNDIVSLADNKTGVTTLNQVTDIYRKLSSPSTPKIVLYMGNKVQVEDVAN